MDEDPEDFAEPDGHAEGSRYYEVSTEANHANVPEHERKDGPPSPMPDHDRQVGG